MALAGSLYQLFSKHECHNGMYVAVNGPYDKFGVVLSSKQKEDGNWLNLIRGCPRKEGQTPAAQF